MSDPTDRRQVDANHASIALFAAIVAAMLAGIGYLSCLGFSDNSPFEWAKYAGLSWFLIHFSLLARKVIPAGESEDGNFWWKSHASLTLAALAFVAALGADWNDSIGKPSGSNLAFGVRAAVLSLFGVAGFLLAGLALVRTWRPRDVIALVLFAGFFSFYVAGASWGSGYQNPLFVEGICFGSAQIDTLFHASLSNMLRTYGVASTGLDGLPFAPYHFGSHWFFARLCNLLDTRVFNFYNRGYAVIFVPLGLFSLGTLALTIAERWHRPVEAAAVGSESVSVGIDRPRRIGMSFWLLLTVGYIGFLPYASNVMPPTAWSLSIIGESYSLAVTFSLLGLAIAWEFFREAFIRRQWGPLDAVGGVLLAILLGLTGLLKISVMLVLAATGLYFVFRLRLYRRAAVWALLPAVAVSLWWALRLTSDPGYSQTGRIVLFGFLRENVEWQWWPYSWLILYAWVWGVVAVRLWQHQIGTLGQLALALRQRRLLDVEFVVVVALVGVVPGLLTAYSATYFFSEYQHWPALALLLSIVTVDRQSRAIETPAEPKWLGQLTLRRVAAFMIVISAGGVAVANTVFLLSQAVGADLSARGHASGQTGLGLALMHGQWKKASEILSETAAAADSRLKTDKRVLAILGSLDEMSLAEKRRSLLFIPKSNRQFWDLLHGPYWPKDNPLVAPALSGVAMIDGLYVSTKEDSSVGYGYHHYPRSNALPAQPNLAQYLPVLRMRCAKMGFTQLIVIDNDSAGTATAYKYDCP